MGVSPIEYEPWTGDRTGHFRRLFVMTKAIFKEKMKSKAVLILLFIGIILVHAFPLIFKVLLPHQELTTSAMIGGPNSIFGGGLFLILSLLLAAVVSSDLISRDLGNNSFVLYFSRPITPRDYLIGKIAGGFIVMSFFCLLPVVIFGVAMIATQSGSDYLASLEVLGLATLSGAMTSYFFLGFGMMLSSITDNRAYAGVGTFMSFFVFSLISGLFSNIDSNWRLANPFNLLEYSYDLIFGNGLPTEINPGLYWLVLVSIMVAPMAIAYWRVSLRSVGK